AATSGSERDARAPWDVRGAGHHRGPPSRATIAGHHRGPPSRATIRIGTLTSLAPAYILEMPDRTVDLLVRFLHHTPDGCPGERASRSLRKPAIGIFPGFGMSAPYATASINACRSASELRSA